MDETQRFCQTIEKVALLDGCIVEVGVGSGASAKELRRLFPDKHLHLFDTFRGLPKEMFNAIIDQKHNVPGMFAHTVEQVKKNWNQRKACISTAAYSRNPLKTLTSSAAWCIATLIITHLLRRCWNTSGTDSRWADSLFATITATALALVRSSPAMNFCAVAKILRNRYGAALCTWKKNDNAPARLAYVHYRHDGDNLARRQQHRATSALLAYARTI